MFSSFLLRNLGVAIPNFGPSSRMSSNLDQLKDLINFVKIHYMSRLLKQT